MTDRRNWLWRKKSSEKIPGETDSSGSISSHSERFSDEQANITQNAASPEVTSKTASTGDENENIKSLTQKLSAALLNVSAKEGLLKQHEKVAEEAVAGWEKAEREVSGLKLQLDATWKKNSALEDRVGHLGEALKECMWQLRESKEEQGQKIKEEITKRSLEWESTKSELEKQLSELRTQLETAKSEAVAAINSKLEAAEKENASLRLELIEISKNLEVRTVERDLSTQAAENASKQHLESIKKVAKLEAEFRLLKSHTRKPSVHNLFVQFDLEANQPETSASAPMDDFHDMERLAALPETKNQPLKAPFDEAKSEKMIDLEKKIEKLEADKLEVKKELIKLRHQLFECQGQLKASQENLKEKEFELIKMKARLIEFEDELQRSQEHTKEVDTRVAELENELAIANEGKDVLESETKSLEAMAEKERTLSAEMAAKCYRLEDELSRTKTGAHLQCSWQKNMDMKAEQEQELAAAASKLADCQKTIASLGRQLESLATLDEILAESDNCVDSCGGTPVFHISGELKRLTSIDCK